MYSSLHRIAKAVHPWRTQRGRKTPRQWSCCNKWPPKQRRWTSRNQYLVGEKIQFYIEFSNIEWEKLHNNISSLAILIGKIYNFISSLAILSGKNYKFYIEFSNIEILRLCLAWEKAIQYHQMRIYVRIFSFC